MRYIAEKDGLGAFMDYWEPGLPPEGYFEITEACFTKFHFASQEPWNHGCDGSRYRTIKKHDHYDEVNGVFDCYMTATWVEDTVEQTFIKEETIWSDLQK